MTPVILALAHTSNRLWRDEAVNLQTDVYPLNSKTRETISWALLAGLLFLRLPLSTGAAYFPRLTWLDPLYEICTYALTLYLIWLEQDRLVLFHIDALVIVMIVFLKPLETLFLMVYSDNHLLAFPGFPSLLIWVSAAVFFFVLRKQRPDLLKVRKTSWRWFGLGVLAGIGKALLLGYPMARQLGPNPPYYKPILFNALLPVLPYFLFQLGYAAVAEEPLFRGFLWGHLRKAGWNEWWIWPFQTLLFMLGHLYYLPQQPVPFWIVVPIGGLVQGLLAWKSRTIASSMAAHGLSNALTTTVARLIVPYI